MIRRKPERSRIAIVCERDPYASPAAEYYDLPDDGAPHTCKECKKEGDASDMYLTLTPDGKRSVMHKTCVDETWRCEFATYKGMYKG